MLHRNMFYVAARFSPPLVAAGFLAFSSIASASDPNDYLGAKAVLKAVAQEVTQPPAQNSADKLIEAINAFQKNSAQLAPEAAAQEWLRLFDAQEHVVESDEGVFYSDLPSHINPMIAIPPPTAWEALKQAVAKRQPSKEGNIVRETALRMIIATLTGDKAAFAKDFEALKKWVPSNTHLRNYYSVINFIATAQQIAIDQSDDVDTVFQILQEQLANTQNERSGAYLRLPDLVTIGGKERAAEFLKAALTTPNVAVFISTGEETVKLARQVALEQIDKLKFPQWQLTHSLDAHELYEAMARRFHDSPGFAVNHDAVAKTYYALGLITRGRTGEAVTVAESLSHIPTSTISELVEKGHGTEALRFFNELLAKNPNLPCWSSYIELAARLGATDQLLTRVREAAKAANSTEANRSALGKHLIQALLAADQMDEGIELLRKASRRKGNPDMALQLGRLGLLLDNPSLVKEALTSLWESIKETQPLRPGGSQPDPDLSEFAQIFFSAGQHREAEGVLLKNLVAKVKEKNAASKQQGYLDPYGCPQALLNLAAFYHQAGRHADVITLFEQSPDWGTDDLATLSSLTTESFGPDHRGLPAGYLLAAALAATGKADQARPIVEALLNESAGYDPAYQLYLEVAGQDALTKLDTLIAENPFEERPLIWKAQLLLDSTQVEEAEKAARKAIALDPSDGEQGPNDRMRAYAVLSEILETRGDRENATLYRNVVRAVRLSEQADRFYQAGLLSRAVTMYKEALTHFADAYCIQSRLARQLYTLGRMEEAEQHYRRAYELMPDSFGRVESHCFGCEQAFEGERQQTLAEKIFTDLTLKNPEKPQAFYLLGYLQDEQGRHQQATENYRAAVKLDPQYMNAWKRLQSAAEGARLPRRERDNIAVTIFKLDPKNADSSTLSQVSNLRLIWETVAAIKPRQEPPTTLYTLKASHQAFSKEGGLKAFTSHDQARPLTPGNAIAEQAMISALSRLLSLN